MKRIITALMPVTIGHYANAVDTITVPWELSEKCKDINVYKNIKAGQAKNECSVEVVTKPRHFLT